MNTQHKERISLEDTTMSALIKLSDGNPGAALALSDLVQRGALIDPDSAFGGLSGLLSLDSMGIYGSDIYILHNDICGRDSVKMLAVLRACQLGLFSESIVKDAASRQDRSGKAMIPVDELLLKVKAELPNFGL